MFSDPCGHKLLLSSPHRTPSVRPREAEELGVGLHLGAFVHEQARLAALTQNVMLFEPDSWTQRRHRTWRISASNREPTGHPLPRYANHMFLKMLVGKGGLEN